MHKTKNKWYTRAIYLGVALAMTVGLLMVPAAGANGAETEVCSCLHVGEAADTAVWDSITVHSETVQALGAYSAKLNNAGAAAGGVNAGFPLDSGITLEEFQDDIDAATPKWSFWYNLETTASPVNGPQFELRFEDPNSTGWLEVTAVGLQGTTGTGGWLEETLAGAKLAGYGGVGETGTSFFAWTPPLTPLSGIEAAVNADAAVGTASDWVLERVRVEMWEAADLDCYVDDATIEGTTYDLEPCYYLDPDIAKNVKTADETFTVMDPCGEVDGDLISDWMVTKGEGTGVVSIIAGGADGENYITVRMVTTGDCIITCNVAGLYHPVNAEKKWGEIYYTELTAWSDDPCDEQRPTGAGDTEISRVIDLGGAASVDALVQEAVIANFLPGPVPAYAGGAKITWWLLENDEDGYAQADLEELVELFDSSYYESGELGYGHGCGQYAEWAGDPTFIPEDIIDTIYATYVASNTLFTDAECVDIVDTTKTVTYTDHVGDPLGEGFTNVLVEFSEVGTTDLAEPVIVVVLADYPLDKNGENAVCVEYFKFKSTVVVIPEVCQVKVPQVRWAGEKIVLEKDWETEPDQLVGFFLEESCVGNMIPFPGDEGTITGYIISEDARTAFTVTDCSGVARAMFESEQQGQVDVKCVLYGASMNVSAMAFDAIVAQTLNGGLEVVGNHGFLVYYLALENVAVDTALSDLTAIDAGEDADVLVKVRGWFTSDTLPGTSRPPVDANGDLVYELPAGRYVLPDDWSALAGSDEATSSMYSRPQYDLMNTPGEGVESDDELGPYDSGVRTTTPPGEAEYATIGPFNTLQPWNCVDDEGDPTNMWIATASVPADDEVCLAGTGCLRNTVVPDGTIDESDCPMPQALVTFEVTDTEVLSTLDKGTALGYGIDTADKFIAPFYAMEIPSHWLIPVAGYRWDSWGGWTTSTADDGPYDLWTDLGITPSADDILEAYSDNHGYAGVTIVGTGLADDCVTLDVIADFPVMAAKYPAVDTDTGVCWGFEVEHLNPDFEVSDRTGVASITISFYGLRLAGTGVPWTTGGTPPYVRAEWDFDDGTPVLVVTGATSALTLATQTHTYAHAGTYSPSLTVTDSSVPPLVHTEKKWGYIVLTGTAGFPLCDIDESGTVNIADFVLFAASYGLSLGDVGYDGRCDLDASDGVGILDFVIFAQCWAVEA